MLKVHAAMRGIRPTNKAFYFTDYYYSVLCTVQTRTLCFIYLKGPPRSPVPAPYFTVYGFTVFGIR